MLGDEAVDEGRDLGDHRLVDLARDRVPPWRSASVTTPTGSDTQALICGSGGPRRHGGERSSRTSSDEPPPMSNRITPSACGSISGVQPVAASVGLGLAVDDLELEPDLLGDAGAELGAVLGRAAGLGRDQPRARDAAVAHLVAADGERLDRALDRRVADAAGGRDALAEPDDAGEGIDDAEAVAGRARDQQPAIVGAEIERGIGRPRRRRPARGAVVTRIAVR